jgi:hypothetical protein
MVYTKETKKTKNLVLPPVQLPDFVRRGFIESLRCWNND